MLNQNKMNYLAHIRRKHDFNGRRNITIGLVGIIWISFLPILAFWAIEKYILSAILVGIVLTILFLWFLNKNSYLRVLLTIIGLYAILGLSIYMLTLNMYIANQPWEMLTYGIVILAVHIILDRIVIYIRISKDRYMDELSNTKKDRLPYWLPLGTGMSGAILARFIGAILGDNVIIQIFLPLFLSFACYLISNSIRYVHIYILEKRNSRQKKA